MTTIVQATTDKHLEHMITLSTEYVEWMIDVIKQMYPEVDTVPFLQVRSYDNVRARFSEKYSPPDGRLFLAMQNDDVCGCAALTKWVDTTCEIQTLFVRPQYRSMGIARQLVAKVISDAQRVGYNTMRLDTLAFMIGAQTLYKSFGFYPISSYRSGSGDIQKHLLFFERKL